MGLSEAEAQGVRDRVSFDLALKKLEENYTSFSTVSFTGVDLGAHSDWVDALVRALGTNTSCTHLDLSGTNLSDGALQRVVAALATGATPQLRALDLRSNSFTLAGETMAQVRRAAGIWAARTLASRRASSGRAPSASPAPRDDAGCRTAAARAGHLPRRRRDAHRRLRPRQEARRRYVAAVSHAPFAADRAPATRRHEPTRTGRASPPACYSEPRRRLTAASLRASTHHRRRSVRVGCR